LKALRASKNAQLLCNSRVILDAGNGSSNRRVVRAEPVFDINGQNPNTS
jgi:hypothetical protein